MRPRRASRGAEMRYDGANKQPASTGPTITPIVGPPPAAPVDTGRRNGSIGRGAPDRGFTPQVKPRRAIPAPGYLLAWVGEALCQH